VTVTATMLRCRVMEWDGAAVTAQRLVSLCCKEGDDDMFSTDLSMDQLQVWRGQDRHSMLMYLQAYC